MKISNVFGTITISELSIEEANIFYKIAVISFYDLERSLKLNNDELLKALIDLNSELLPDGKLPEGFTIESVRDELLKSQKPFKEVIRQFEEFKKAQQ